MSESNQDGRVARPLQLVSGPLAGETLLSAFKAELIKERPLQVMFGTRGERIFDDKRPSMNETILPALLLAWKSETFNSNDAYLDGMIEGLLALPVRLTGDFNSLRRVASMLQRFMGGSMNLFDKVPGLTRFGYGTEFNYEGLAAFDGFTAPVIQMSIPFRFDLQLLRLQTPGFDPQGPLDDADVGFIESISLQVLKQETTEVLIPEGVLIETGQTN